MLEITSGENRWRRIGWWLYLPAVIFFASTGLSLSLVETGQLSQTYLLLFAYWLALTGGAELAVEKWGAQTDRLLIPIVSFLMGWGLWLVARLAPNFLLRQSIWVGLAMILIVAIIIWPGDVRWFRRYPYTFFLIGLVLLGMTFVIGVNPAGASARYWLKIPFLNAYFQPSELLKLFFLIFLAGYFDQRDGLLKLNRRIGRFGPLPYLLPLVVMWGFCLSLLIWQRDLGAATLFFVIFIGILFLATGERRYLLIGGGLAVCAGIAGYWLFGVVRLRVDAWVNPWPDASGRAFQIVQSLYAIAAGGVMGEGVGQGYPIYIPVVHSDFVFAAVAEEWGMIGGIVLILLFAILTMRAFRIALSARWGFDFYLSAGVGLMIATQSILIMGGVTRLLPLTGVTLPFISYGGSSMLVSAIMLGLLGRVAKRAGLGGRRPILMSRSATQAGYMHRMYSTLLLFWGGLALLLFVWGIVRSAAFAERDDNPRRVEAEQRTVRGRITDTNGVVLALNEGEIGAIQTRIYPLPIAEPVIGYYSLRHGTAGVEESMDEVLRGAIQTPWESWLQDWMNEPDIGQNIRLTLAVDLQANTMQLLEDQKGAVIVLSLQDGAIRAMGSAPSFDPNLLDDRFDQLIEDEDAPLVNRGAQGRYQPGRVLEPFLLADALENGDLTEEAIAGPLSFDGDEASRLVRLERIWTEADLIDSWDRFQFLTLPTVPIPLNDELELEVDQFSNALRGDDNLTVVPLQVAIAAAGLANGGAAIEPQLVAAVQSLDSEGGEWVAYAPNGDSLEEENGANQWVSPETASAILAQLPQSDQGVEWAVTVESGPDRLNSWYVGIGPQYVVVVVLEQSDAGNLSDAETIGREILRLARE